MSLAFAEPALPPEPVLPEAMPDGVGRPGLALSVALHLVLGSLFIFGLPTLFHPPTPQEMPIAVQLVTMGPETRATHPNPNMPEPKAKPDVPVPGPPGPKPEPEPTPPNRRRRLRPPRPRQRRRLPAPPEQKPAPPPPPPPLPEPKPAPPPAAKAGREGRSAPADARKATADRAGRGKGGSQEIRSRPVRRAVEKPGRAGHRAVAGRAAAEDAGASAAASSQPRAPLGSQLTASELDMVREQIARCWNIPAGARDAKDLVVEIRVVVDPDGMVQQATIVDQAPARRDPFFRAAAESARRAFFNPLCRPLRLPPDKYEIWKDLVVDFSPKDFL